MEAEADSSSSQWRMCLTLRLKTAADCLTSLLSSRITALTPATVSMKFVNAIWLCFWVRPEEKGAQKRERYLYLFVKDHRGSVYKGFTGFLVGERICLEKTIR